MLDYIMLIMASLCYRHDPFPPLHLEQKFYFSSYENTCFMH